MMMKIGIPAMLHDNINTSLDPEHVRETQQWSEDAEDPEGVEYAEDPKDAEDTEDAEDAEDAEIAKDAEDPEDASNAEDSEGAGYVENFEHAEDAEALEDAEVAEDSNINFRSKTKELTSLSVRGLTKGFPFNHVMFISRNSSASSGTDVDTKRYRVFRHQSDLSFHKPG